jgi:hypothetical protein
VPETTWPVPTLGNNRARAVFHAVTCPGGVYLQVSFPLSKGRTLREQPVRLRDGHLRFFRVGPERVPRYVRLGLDAEFDRARRLGSPYGNDMKESR